VGGGACGRAADPRSPAFFAELAAKASEGLDRLFPISAEWTQADEAAERERDRLAGILPPDEERPEERAK
jgi:hypothetical protein